MTRSVGGMLLNYDSQAESLDLAELVDDCEKSLSERMQVGFLKGIGH